MKSEILMAVSQENGFLFMKGLSKRRDIGGLE